jgi:putative aldouronate transport system permease protein
LPIIIKKQLGPRVEKTLLIALRALAIACAFLLFVPGLNPARISGLMAEGSSFFTAIVSYSSIGGVFVRALNRGWVQQGTLNLAYGASVIAGLGIAAIAAAGCMSLAYERLRKIGSWIGLAGAIVGALGMTLLISAQSSLAASSGSDRLSPLFPQGIKVYLLLFVASAIVAAVLALFGARPVIGAERPEAMPAKYSLFLMMLPFLVLIIVFSYLPLYGWRYAFYDYKPGIKLNAADFTGFKWFLWLFQNPAVRNDLLRVLKNTLAMSGIGIATSWLPMAFAIFMSEMGKSGPRRFVQTVTTIPNFISWVLVYAVAFALFSTEGFVNSILIDFGFIKEGSNFLMSSQGIWLKMWAWGTWKGLGWSAIIYMAGISGIDQQLYEAATIDGADRFQRMWHITVPGLMPTFYVLFLLGIANILSNGMDQYLVFRNQMNKSPIEVLDLYVYTMGLGANGSGNIPLATVVGMFKSIISVTLLFTANKASKILRGESIV